MNIDGQEVVAKVADRVRDLTIENANLQVLCEKLSQERLEQLSKIAQLEGKEAELNKEIAELEDAKN